MSLQIRNAMNKQMLDLDQEVKSLRESQQELKEYKVGFKFYEQNVCHKYSLLNQSQKSTSVL